MGETSQPPAPLAEQLPRIARISLVSSVVSAIVAIFFWAQAVGKETLGEYNTASALAHVSKTKVDAVVVEVGYKYSGNCNANRHNQSFTRCSVSEEVDSICRQSEFTDSLLLSSDADFSRRLRGAHGTGYHCSDRFEPWIRVRFAGQIDRCAYILGLENYNPRHVNTSLKDAVDVIETYAMSAHISTWVAGAKNSCIVGFGPMTSLIDNFDWIVAKRNGYWRDTWIAASIAVALLVVSSCAWFLSHCCISDPLYTLVPTDGGDVDHAVLFTKVHRFNTHQF